MRIHFSPDEFPWPKNGDKLVTATFGGSIAFLHFKTFSSYASGYKRSADILIEHIRQQESDQDLLVYPVIFLYRHYIELMLKAIITIGQRVEGCDVQIPPHHKLENLWDDAKKIIRTHFPEADNPASIVGNQILEFAKLDNSGEECRYPVLKSGEPSLEQLDKIDLENFSQVIDRISVYLDTTYSMLHDYLQEML